MKVIDLDNLNIPNKKEEEFSKVDFSKLFSYDFKHVERYEFDIMGLPEVEDNKTYDNFLFDLTYSHSNKQVVLTINSNIPEPVCLIHKLKDDDTFYTNSLKIEVKKDCTASIIEVFTSTSKNSAYSVNRSFVCEKNSDFEYMKIQDIDESNSFLYSVDFSQESNTKVNFLNFDLGDGFIVNNFINKLESENCEYNLYGLVKSVNSSYTSNLVKTLHTEPSSLSNIEFKHSLKDKAKAVFKVKSRVEKEAINTKAFQSSNTILLSDDASIFAQPHLEILIDELEASHGATTGTLDEDQLLYLQMRGIEKSKAEEILLKAFESQIYAKIQDDLIKEFLLDYRRSKYV
jgi:Fe-S cluster assembly protein SufD